MIINELAEPHLSDSLRVITEHCNVLSDYEY